MTKNNETQNEDIEQPGLGDLISLREAAELSGLSVGHLRLLVNQGKLWGG